MKKFKFVFYLFSILLLGACSMEDTASEFTAPQKLEFELAKTFEYAYLGQVGIVDYSEDLGLLALWDYQRVEFLIANDEEIVLKKQLSGDGKDSYGSYFQGAKFWKDKFVVFQATGYFVYDLELNLLERVPLPYYTVMASMGPFTHNVIVGDYLIYYGNTAEVNNTLEPPADPVVVWDLKQKRLHGTVTTPADIPQVWALQGYTAKSAIFSGHENQLAILYPYHPMVYFVDLEDLAITSSQAIGGDRWKNNTIINRSYDDRMEAMFDNLTYHSFSFLHWDGDMVLSVYESGLPRSKVDELPRDVIGGWFDLELEHRKPRMVALHQKEKVSEIDYPFGITKWADGYRMSTFPIDEGYRAKEEDFIRFYLYKPILKPIAAEE